MNNDYLIQCARTQETLLRFKSPRDEKVLQALGKVDRINFLPSESKSQAYEDKPVSIGYRVNCSQPSVVAFMADVLELYEGGKVFELGTGCGYAAAVTGHLIGESGKLTSIEIVPDLYEFGRRNLEQHFGKLENRITVLYNEGSRGYMPHAPYDRMYFTAALPLGYPTDQFLKQLAPEGIALIPQWKIPEAIPWVNGCELVKYHKKKGEIHTTRFPFIDFVMIS